MTNTCLSCLLRQNMSFVCKKKYACHDKNLVTTKVVTKHKHIFVMITDLSCCNKHAFVMTKVSLLQENFLLQQNCYDKNLFVTTSILLSWQTCTNTCLLRQKFCHDKNNTCVSSRQWYKDAGMPTPLLHFQLSNKLNNAQTYKALLLA